MVALSDESTLSNLIVGRVTETADMQRAALNHRNFVVLQAKKNESFDSISKDVFNKLSQAKVKLNKFDVESIYESKSVGDDNANVWFEATEIDKTTKDKIKTVRSIDFAVTRTNALWLAGERISYQAGVSQERTQGR